MFRIVEKDLQLEFPRGHHIHCMVCQIPNQLDLKNHIYQLTDPTDKWQQILSILKLSSTARGSLRKLHFLLFPESSLPYKAIPELLEYVANHFRPNQVIISGIEHIDLSTYIALLEKHKEDNRETLESVKNDLESGDIDDIPVNCCMTLVKEADGGLRVFIQAKSHPFFGEETVNPFHDLYRGKIFPLFRCRPTGFNFMALICLDYVYRDLYNSNIAQVIEKANELFFQTRQRLDLLCVLECNHKPEHKAFRDVVNGFYGEYLSYTPGVRHTTTVFCNSSNETTGLGNHPDDVFGCSMVILHHSHKIAASHYTAFRTDDFDGLPVCRYRFGSDTRLYYFNLPLFHELDPRTTRFPLKIHAIYRPEASGWRRLCEESTEGELDSYDSAAALKRDTLGKSDDPQT